MTKQSQEPVAETVDQPSDCRSGGYLAFWWDSFRWRFVAAWHIANWCMRGAPTKYIGLGKVSRWAVATMAWDWHRAQIMYPHERHKYRPIDDVIAELEQEAR